MLILERQGASDVGDLLLFLPFCLPPLLPVLYKLKVPLENPNHGRQTAGDIKAED